MALTINRLTSEYINLVSDIYPGRSTIWNIDRPNLGKFTKSEIEKYVEALNLIHEKVNNLASNTVGRKQLIDSIKLRIFELAELKEWQSKPQFYFEKVFHTITVLWEINKYYEIEEIDLEVFEGRLKAISKMLSEATENLKESSLSRIDCKYSIQRIQESWKFIKDKAEKSEIIDKDSLEELDSNIERFIHFLEDRLMKTNMIMRPIGNEKFEKLLNLELGEPISIRELNVNLIEFMESYDSCSFKNYENDTCFDEYYQQNIERIVNLGTEWFGLNCEIVSKIEVKKNNEMSKSVMTGAYLDSSLSDLNKGLYIYNEKLNSASIYQKDLNIIHEIYPGHYYTTSNKKIEHKSESAIMISENSILYEGWAKYCEWFYACNLFENELYIEYHRKNFSTSAVLALAVLDIHYHEKGFKEIANAYCSNYGFSKEKVESIVLQAYLSPIECISYATGFFYFRNMFIDLDEGELKKAHKEVIEQNVY